MKMKKTAYLSVLGIFALLATACGPKGNNSKSENPEDFYEAPTEGERAFTSVTTFDEPVEFHTAAQKEFLEYDEKPYEQLTANDMKKWAPNNGSNDYSTPLPIEIEFAQDSAGVSKYQLQISRDYKFVDNVKTVEVGADATKFQVYNLFSGTDYYYKVKAIYDDETTAVSATNKLTTVEGVRNMLIEGMYNVRDLGGKATVDGGYIRQGLLYRTAAMDDGQSGSIITNAGKVRMMEDIKPKTEIELRGGSNGLDKGEAQNRNDSVLGSEVDYQFKGMAYSGGKNLLFRNVELVRQVFDVLGEEESYPVFFHCRIGTDRTGLIALLVNALCGLDLQSLYQDYLLSNFAKISKNFGCTGNGEDTVAGYISEIAEFPGEKLQNSAYNFLLACGVPAEKLDTVIRVLTTDGSVTGNNAKRTHIATASELGEVGGAATVTKKNLRQPAEAIKMSAVDDGVSYSFNAEKEFTCDLFANLMSNYTTGKLSDAVSVKLNGEELSVADTSLATSALGFDSSIECWIPTKLASITVPAGENTIDLSIKSTLGGKGLQISQFALSNMSADVNIG